MRHLMLLETMNWIASGIYFDEHGKEYKVNGQSKVKRDKERWSISGFMEVLLDTPIKFYNDYEVEPTDDNCILKWTSFNPGLGKLCGKFSFIDDAIISDLVSEDEKYSGFEVLTLLNEKTYKAIGICFDGEKRISSWSVILKADNVFCKE